MYIRANVHQGHMAVSNVTIVPLNNQHSNVVIAVRSTLYICSHFVRDHPLTTHQSIPPTSALEA